MVQHLDDDMIINSNQHGFRKKRSCITQLLSRIEQIDKAPNEGEEVDDIYLDFSKAFDKH